MSIWSKIENFFRKSIELPPVEPPVEPYRGGNMYDLFVKKNIEKTSKKSIETLDKAFKEKNAINEDYKSPMRDDDWVDWNWTPPPKKEIKRIYSDIDPYGEEDWDDTNTNIPFQKDYWFPTNEQIKDLESLSWKGPMHWPSGHTYATQEIRDYYRTDRHIIHKKFVIPVSNKRKVFENTHMAMLLE